MHKKKAVESMFNELLGDKMVRKTFVPKTKLDELKEHADVKKAELDVLVAKGEDMTKEEVTEMVILTNEMFTIALHMLVEKGGSK